MRNISLLFLCPLFFVGLAAKGQEYKRMMEDPSYNYYEVVKAADAFFLNSSKGKGSGYIGYERWKYFNEPRFAPSGVRANKDLQISAHAFENFIADFKYPKSKLDWSQGWVDLGPYDADSITSHYSSGIGRVESFYVDPTNTQKIYLGSRSGGFWRTTDEGSSWQNTTDFLVASGVNTISASPTNSDSVLINVRNAYNGYTHGIYRSTDGGLNWSLSNFNPTNLSLGGLGSNFSINVIYYHPKIKDLILIGCNTGLYRSDDNLASWSKVLNGNIRDIAFHPTNNAIIYLTSSSNASRIYISQDSGQSFSTSNIISGNSSWGYVACSPSSENMVIFSSSSGVWKSNNLGQDFQFLHNPDESCRGMAVSDVDSNVILYGYVDLQVSTNGGDTFTQATVWSQPYSSSYIHADIRALEVLNGSFYVGTDGYFCKSDDNGTTWTKLNNGTGIRENYRLGLSQGNWSKNMVGSQDNGTSIYDNQQWIEWNGGDGMEAIIHPLNTEWMIGSWQYGTRNRTKDGGQSRQGIGTPESGSSQAAWVAPLLMNPSNQMEFYHFSRNMHKASEFGNKWELAGSPGMDRIDLAAIAENNSDIIAAVDGNRIRITFNAGSTWWAIDNPDLSHSLTNIAFDPKRDSSLVITYGSYVNNNKKIYISHDLGVNWTNITYNLGNMPLRSVVIDHQDSSYIYVGAEIGVYYKSMQGTHWHLYNNNLPNVTINDLKIHRASNTLRAASWGRGLWEFSLVGREDYPAILLTEISNTPSEITPNHKQAQYIRSTLSSDIGADEVYAMYSINSKAFNQRLDMSLDNGSQWKTNENIPLSDSNDQVFFKVFATKGSKQTESYPFMYTVRPGKYCDATGNNSTTSDFINFVELNNLSHTSGQDYYGDFSDSIVELRLNQSYDITVGMQYHWDPDTTAAWIDFNNDLIFEESERILMSEIDADHYSYGNFTVPSNAVVADTLRMRVRSQYWNETPTPCGSRTGEVEDYSVVISDALNIENLQTRHFSIYPNPSTGLLQLRLNGARVEGMLEVFSLNGQRIKQSEVKNGLVQLNLASGLYFIRFNTGNEFYFEKLRIL